jgi:hypothetical protein
MAFHEGWVEADGFRIRFMEADRRWFTCTGPAVCI